MRPRILALTKDLPSLWRIPEAAWFGPGDVMPKYPPRGFSIAGELIHANLPR